jgi:hypothetical protein
LETGASLEPGWAEGALCMFVPVLDANSHGRAFWVPLGRRHVLSLPERGFGVARHVPHRLERRR